MRKWYTAAFVIIMVMAITAEGGLSSINAPVSEDKLIMDDIKRAVSIESDGFERYVWFNGDREEQVFAALDEVAIFPKNVSETTNVTDMVVRSFDQHASLITDYGFVSLVRLPNRVDSSTIGDKIAGLQARTGTNASFVFYRGPKKDQAPMALPGEIIVHFRLDWDEHEIADWARDRGLEPIKSYSFSPNTYLFSAGSGLRSLEIANRIYLSGEVIYAYPNWWQVIKLDAIPTDPKFSDQWHLRNTGQGGGTAGEDVNITSVWDTYRGSENEVIAIVDDAIEHLHEDLAPNSLCYMGYCWDYEDNDNDPTPAVSHESHGTAVTGVAVARGWNALGVTGAAPNTTFVGYRLGGAFTPDTAADAMTRNMQIVDVYSNSWIILPIRGLRPLVPVERNAFAYGTTNGRGGKGNIYVFAGGNDNNKSDALYSDNTNYNGFANSRYVMAIAASNNFGGYSSYSTNGATILINAPSNGGSRSITTTDLTGPSGYSATNYTSTFGGTSAATPLVSGIISLMLQANPNLSWRDVRLILAKTAEKNNPTDPEWITNGAGLNISHKLGFGRLDAYAAVNTAANWTNIGPEVTVTAFRSPNLPIPDNNLTGVSDTISITQNISIEFVESYFTAADHPAWNHLEIELISPSGTVSILAKEHYSASDSDRYNNWTFGSVRHLGESSQGTWRLVVRDRWSGDTGTLQSWGLVLYGATPLPAAPNVTTTNATMVEETSATLNGVLTSDGGETCQCRFAYDTTPGEPYAYNTDWTGSKTTGQSFSHALTGLTKGTKYYFRAQVKNSAGTASGAELTFLTKPDAPTSFSATAASSTQINLSWSKGAGAQKTKIQRKTGSYPSNRDDGSTVYTGTGASTSDSGLVPNTTYYYRAWSYVQGSEQWSDTYAQALNRTLPGVLPRWDINEDGEVDDLDLGLLLLYYGETTLSPYPRWDINEDGEVDDLDLGLLLVHYGE